MRLARLVCDHVPKRASGLVWCGSGISASSLGVCQDGPQWPANF